MIDPYLLIKFILIGLLVSGLISLGWIGLKALFKKIGKSYEFESSKTNFKEQWLSIRN